MIPRFCNYFVTLRCNDTCAFSPFWQKEEYQNIGLSERENQKIGISEYQEIFKKLKRERIRYLNLTGGEPLLRDDLSQILKSAKELTFKIELTTNGILYPEKAREMKGLIDSLYFYLDYPVAEEHDRSRGVECFHLVIKSIGLAKELGERPIINFTLTRDSVRFLPEMVELSERLKVFVYLNPVYDFYGTQGFEKETIDYIYYFRRKKNVLINLAALELVKAGGNNVLLPRCKAKESVVTLLPDGKRVSPCFFNPGGNQGRDPICSSCLRWPYMLPSFTNGFDKYLWLNFYSRLEVWRKCLL